MDGSQIAGQQGSGRPISLLHSSSVLYIPLHSTLLCSSRILRWAEIWLYFEAACSHQSKFYNHIHAFHLLSSFASFLFRADIRNAREESVTFPSVSLQTSLYSLLRHRKGDASSLFMTFDFPTIHCTLLTVHYTLHNLHLSLHTTHCLPYTKHFTIHTAHCTLLTLLYTAQYTLLTKRCKTHTSHYTLHNSYFTLHTAHCLPYTAHNTLIVVHSNLHTIQFTLRTVHSTLYNAHLSMHTAPLTLHTAYCVIFSSKLKCITAQHKICTRRRTGAQRTDEVETFSLFCIELALHIIHSTLHSSTPHCSLHAAHMELHTPRCTLHAERFKPHATDMTLHMTSCTLPTSHS